MDPSSSRTVYRYFEPADVFVQIRICDTSVLAGSKPGLNRAAYRRMVLEACLPDFAGELEELIHEIAPDDPLLLEDLLYQLCIEVNPVLDIHTVRLGSEQQDKSEASSRGQGSDASDFEAFLKHLRKRAKGLPRRLAKRVLGQKNGIDVISRAVEKAAVGLAMPGRPLGAYLFVGRTGTGKTELARTLAEELFGAGKRKGLVRIDCAEYALAHEYAKLIGAPPGYVGHEDGGQLTEAVLQNPESVVLFDEIEKANPRMHNLLLSILEEGCLTDNKGRRVSFERAFVLLTSNAGASEMIAARRQVGFERTGILGAERLFDIATQALEQQFSPEFLGRLDETVLFAELDPKTAQKIAQRQLSELARRAREARAPVAFTPSVAKWIARRGFSPEYGARELRRVIRREIEAPLSQLLLEHGDALSGMIRVRIQDEKPVFIVES